MPKHEQEDCPWLQRICPYDPDHKVFNCAYEVRNHDNKTRRFVLNNQQEHVENCLMRPFTCPNDGCGLELRRKELQIHLDDECEFAAVPCPFSHSGCLALVWILHSLSRHSLIRGQVFRKDIGKHLRDNTELHLSMLAKRVKVSNTSIECMCLIEPIGATRRAIRVDTCRGWSTSRTSNRTSMYQQWHYFYDV